MPLFWRHLVHSSFSGSCTSQVVSVFLFVWSIANRLYHSGCLQEKEKREEIVAELEANIIFDIVQRLAVWGHKCDQVGLS